MQPIIHLAVGSLRGKVNEAWKGKLFYSFEGIPFAEPPIGKLRFKAPRKPIPWEGIRDATESQNGCFSKDLLFGFVQGSEDCLYLNVYTPHIPKPNESTALKPVMVWVHGGGFVSGSGKRSKYGPEFLLEKDVVLVTLNYRVGALGFLHLNDPKLCVTGNAALKDIVMALKWVHQHIKAFGGDTDNITLFGESAGAAAVAFQLVSPMAKGLFHKAIVQSGAATCSWANGEYNNAYKLAEKMGKEFSNDIDVLEMLQAATKEEILEAQIQIGDAWKPSQRRIFCPVVETPNMDEEMFLPDKPINLIKSGNYNKVPLIIGCTSQEGLLAKALAVHNKIDLYPSSDEDLIPATFGLKSGSDVSKKIGAKIREYYYGKEKPSSENTPNWVRYISDAYFLRDCLYTAENILSTSGKEVYLYKFDYKTRLNLYSVALHANGEGVCHGEDLFYLFKRETTPDFKENSDEADGIERVTTWWSNFAKYTNPNGFKFEGLWPRATLDKLEYLHIGKQFHANEHLDKNMNDFWKTVEPF